MCWPSDLIFVSIEDWDDVWRRNQFVCAEWVARHSNRRILFVGLPRSVPNELRHGRVRKLLRRATYAVPGGSHPLNPHSQLATSNSQLPRITITHPLKLLPDTLAVGRAINQWMSRRHVRRVARRLGFRRPVLWINPHWAGHMAGRMGESAVIYDVTDDWTRMSQSDRMTQLVRRQDAELCGKADAVIVCSKRLLELKKPLCSNVHLIANGVDFGHYEGVLGSYGVEEIEGEKSEIRSTKSEINSKFKGGKFKTGGGGGGGIRKRFEFWISRFGFISDFGFRASDFPPSDSFSKTQSQIWQHPVLGYTGTIHPDRVDVELIRAVAQKWPGSIVLVGPDFLNAADGERIKLPNMHRVGPVAYAAVPGVMAKFDACIVPHVMSAFTESLNPIKLWEYLAAGKPIVSTDVAGFRDYPELVRLAKTTDEFVAAAHAAAAEGGTVQGDELARKRQAVARENSWQRRVDEIERVIDGVAELRVAGCELRVVGGEGSTPETTLLSSLATNNSQLAAHQQWVHIPTLGDHYSPDTGSAIITVIRAMNHWHLAAGGSARVLVQRNTWQGYDDGVRQEVDFGREGPPSKFAKLIDGGLGLFSTGRLMSGRHYREAARALGAAFDGVVFIYNEPAGVERIAKQCPNAKVVLWAENELFRTYTSDQAKRVVQHAHRVICCSEFVAAGLRVKVGDDNRIVVVLNGVDPAMFTPATTPPANLVPVVLFVGRVIQQKGVHLLIKAAHRLHKDGVLFRLRIVGSSGFNAADRHTLYERKLRRMAKGLQEVIEFVQFQSRPKIVGVYQSADVFCLPSCWDDPCPLTAGEALACGLPTVASRRGGIPEIGGDAMLLFDPDDVDDLPGKLRTLLTDLDLRNGLAVKARERAMQLAWQRQYERVVRVVNAVFTASDG